MSDEPYRAPESFGEDERTVAPLHVRLSSLATVAVGSGLGAGILGVFVPAMFATLFSPKEGSIGSMLVLSSVFPALVAGAVCGGVLGRRVVSTSIDQQSVTDDGEPADE